MFQLKFCIQIHKKFFQSNLQNLPSGACNQRRFKKIYVILFSAVACDDDDEDGEQEAKWKGRMSSILNVHNFYLLFDNDFQYVRRTRLALCIRKDFVHFPFILVSASLFLSLISPTNQPHNP